MHFFNPSKGESLPLARTLLLATPSNGGHPRNAPTSIQVKKSLNAGPSDGKKSKVSPVIRGTSGVNAAVSLPVPPYFLFPASHIQRFFNLYFR